MSIFENRHIIRKRLLADAAREWGYKHEADLDIEHLDPVTEMLFASCAYEFERVNHEIHNSRNRIFEQLLEILTPQEVLGPTPGHTIAHVNPTEDYFITDCTDNFTIKNITSNIEYNFTPADKYLLQDVHVELIACNNTIKKISDKGDAEVVAKSVFAQQLVPHHFYIGLRVNSRINTLENCSLFFNWNSLEPNIEYHSNLKASKWYVANEPLEITQSPASIDNDETEIFDVSAYINEIKIKTNKDFVNISSQIKNLDKHKSAFHSDFKDIFSDTDLEKIKDNLVWIKVVFPVSFSDLLKDCTCFTNCFPIVNRKLIEKNERIVKGENLIGLDTANAYFLDIDSVIEGDRHLEEIQNTVYANQLGTWYLRKSGVNKFDSRDAMQNLLHTMDMVHEESVAFNSLGIHNLQTELQELDQSLKRINKNIAASNKVKDGVIYLYILPHNDPAATQIKYWITQGDLLGKINAFTNIKSISNSSYQSQNSYIVKAVSNGKKPPNQNGIVNLFKSSILSHQRIVTQEDIITFCKNYLGQEHSESIRIFNEIGIGKSNTLGLINNLVVELKPVNMANIQDTTIIELETILNEKSISESLIVLRVLR